MSSLLSDAFLLSLQKYFNKFPVLFPIMIYLLSLRCAVFYFYSKILAIKVNFLKKIEFRSICGWIEPPRKRE